MNTRQIVAENRAIQRRYENKYHPPVARSIQSTVNETISAVKSHGVHGGISFLNKKLLNPGLTQELLKMDLEVGQRFARKQWIQFTKQKRGKTIKQFANHESIKCPNCGSAIANVESGMGYITCPKCGESFSSNKSLSTKGFGFNAEWVQRLKDYLFSFITQQSFSIFTTTKDVLIRTLNKSIEEGWGVDKTVAALEELNLSDYQAARIVRTEITRASNAGTKVASETFPYEQSKEWIAAHDDRTRHAHELLDGVVIDVEDYFIDEDGNALMFPGDPTAPVEAVVNCRCSMAVVGKVNARGRLIPKENVNA